MNYRVGLVALAVLVSAVAFHGLSAEQEPDTTLQIGGQEITVEVADTPEERKEGLMHRRELPEDHGMIFIYPDEDNRSFWMKNTYIPLDIIFVDSEGQVINIEKANPEPDTPDEDLESYRSEAPAQYVIEVEQGFTREHGISSGSKVVFGEELADCCINSP